MQRDPLQTIVKCSLVKEQLRAETGSAVAAQHASMHVERIGHDGACALPPSKRQEAMVAIVLRAATRWMLDFALPPRCAGYGTIVADVHSFSPARLPRIRRTRAALAYVELARSLAIRLNYGRKVAVARTMARDMAPLVGEAGDRPLVPVPLHRTLLWSRGFSQSALVAREFSRKLGIGANPLALIRIRRTPPLNGMSPVQRRKTVAGALRVRDRAAVACKTIILIDDLLTTGSTAEPAPGGSNAQAPQSGAGQLDARGETFAVDALMPMPKYPA